MTMHGECTSPVTTPLASISTRPFAKITPSKRPEITTRLPSICPSTLAPSPRITVCSEMMLPLMLPSTRNVPVTVSVPSRVTPWSMNPVHSSLAVPLFDAPGHFQAMEFSQTDSSTVAVFAGKSTRGSQRVVESGDSIHGIARKKEFIASFHQTVVEAHKLRFIVIFKQKVPRPHFCFLSQQ